MKQKKTEIAFYKSDDGSVNMDVQLDKETVWLTQAQMCELLGRDQSVISRHVRNVFKEKELIQESNMQKMHIAGSDKPVTFYSLDVVISTGYRVKSQRGTEFRIWATNVLKQHIVEGYSENKRRLKQLNQTLRLAADISKRKALSTDEISALLQTVSEYSYALELLDDYDHQRVSVRKVSRRKAKSITYEEVIQLIDQMKSKYHASSLFGKEKDASLKSSLSAIMQSYGGKDLYPSIEEKAANLLYFLVKNHSFVDGNKRIAAAVFLRFAEKNNLIHDKTGNRRIADNALVAMTLMIAESRPKEKEVITVMLTNLIAGK